jgi:oligopeptide/dipeptide ABC transporter ATP-binding protein
MKMSLLRIENAVKRYQSGSHLRSKTVLAVRGVSLYLEQGECLAIVGESGSGKSTLGRLAVGLEPPTEGRILFKEKELNAKRMDRGVRQALQMVYQNSFEATNPRFTARQVIEEPIRYFHLAPKSDWNARIDALLARVGIPVEEAGKKTYEFSGGQLQRICIARALAASPELILLDEPLSSLDVSVQAQILNLLKKLKEEFGLTYMLISHDLETVYNLADRLAVMYYGKVVEEIDTMDLFDALCHPYTTLLTGKDFAVNGQQDSEESREGCVYAARCAKATDCCRHTAPALVEIEPGHRIACHMFTQAEKSTSNEGDMS